MDVSLGHQHRVITSYSIHYTKLYENLSKLIDNQTFYSIDLRRLMLKQGRKVTKYLDVMSEYLLNGNIKPTVGRVFPFSQIKESYRYMENRGNIGKIVVKTSYNFV